MKISFDFDSCLSEEIIQNLAKIFISSNMCEVFIITSRFNDDFNKNIDILKIADELNIKKENIFYTQSDYKWQIIKKLNINIHFDDMEDEVHLINANGGCALLFNFDVETTKYLLNDLENGKLQKNTLNINKI
jgi:hypothetical protein